MPFVARCAGCPRFGPQVVWGSPPLCARCISELGKLHGFTLERAIAPIPPRSEAA